MKAIVKAVLRAGSKAAPKVGLWDQRSAVQKAGQMADSTGQVKVVHWVHRKAGYWAEPMVLQWVAHSAGQWAASWGRQWVDCWAALMADYLASWKECHSVVLMVHQRACRSVDLRADSMEHLRAALKAFLLADLTAGKRAS